jgi:hypothetical protein
MEKNTYYKFYRWGKMGPKSNYKLYFYIKFSLSILQLLIPDDDLIRQKNILCLTMKNYEVKVRLTVPPCS